MIVRLTHLAITGTAVVVLSGWLQPGAQQAAPGSVPTFHRTVRRVVLDVVVTDKDNRSVRGLGQGMFSVQDNDAPQKIVTFEENDLDAPLRLADLRRPNLPPATFMNLPHTPERGPLYIIVYDMVDTGWGNHNEDQIVARQTLEKFVTSKPAGTRFELYVLSKDLRLVQGFTSDPEQLLQAFDTARQRGHIPWVFLYRYNYGRDLVTLPFQAMMYIARSLEGLPGRKNLIWISSEFKVPLAGPGPGAGTSATSGTIQQQMAPAASAGEESVSALNSEMRQAADALNAAQVSVYPVDVQGLNPDAPGGGIDLTADEVAMETGGKAYYNTNDLVGAIQDAVENGGTYYEISYAPTEPDYDGSLHRIEMKLDRPGYNLQYRRFYYADDPDAPAVSDKEKKYDEAIAGEVRAHNHGDTLSAWMEHGAPEDHDILFRAHFSAGPESMASSEQMVALVDQPAYFVVRKTDKPARPRPPIPLRTYTISYLVLDRSAGQNPGGQVLEFAACAYDVDGKMLNGISQQAARADSVQRDKSGEKGWLRAVQTIDVPDSAAWLRVAVRDTATDRIGTIEIPLPLAGEIARAGASRTTEHAQDGQE